MARTAKRARPAPPTAVTTQTVPIEGMTCRACERRIEREIRKIPEVLEAHASAVHGQVTITSSEPLDEIEVELAIEDAGYAVGRSAWFSRDVAVWLTAGIGIVVVAALALLAGSTGITDLAPGASTIADGGLVVALLLGLAAGVSTCLALTGGLVLALSAAYAARPGADEGSLVTRLRPSAIFIVGRIIGFAVLGAGLGAVGATVAMPSMLVAVLMVVVAILMTLIGVRLTGLSPRIAAWSPTLPDGLARRLGVDGAAISSYSDTRAAVLGVATFFLPCGFTQAVQVYALSTGSPLTAGAIMAVFAIGTAPGLLALAGLPTLVPGSARPAFVRVVGVVVLGFAILNATAGLRLLGVTPTVAFEAPTTATPVVAIEDGVQVLRTFQVANGYLPADAALYAGLPTRWIIESLAGGSCAIFLQSPALGLAVTLEEGDNPIDLPPLEPGRIAYTCSMGMYGGTLTVVDAPDGVLEGLAAS